MVRKEGFSKSKTYSTQLLWVVFDRFRIQDLSVVLANIEIVVFVVGQDDLLLEVTKLQVRHIIVNLHWGLIRPTGFLAFLSFLLLLLKLLRSLLRLAGKVASVDLAAQDRSLRPIAPLYAECNLLQNKLRLLSSGHGTECLHLQLAQNIGGGMKITVRFLDVGKNAGDTSSLDFDEKLQVTLIAVQMEKLYLEEPTFPSVTVRKVSITDSFTSMLGVSSRKPMTTCTILVVACLSCPCFFDRRST